MLQATADLDRTNRTRPVAATTRALLTCGAIAGPLYIAVATGQALTREGFDIRRHAVSLLANGDLGWIQILNFVVTGVLTIAGARGLRQALRGTHDAGGHAASWGPRLIAVYGLSLIAAGAFVADPSLGFPAGTPDGPPVEVTWHGVAHFAAGGVGFLTFVVACLLLARRFAADSQRGWAAWSALTGIGFLGAFAGIASGGAIPGINVVFTIAVVLAWTWTTALMMRLRAEVARDGTGR
ncbi:MAG TPA: DUF998 domain-containing protein [Euzebyales bacterium]|nr:DUF998 domain-containing protein [Euzebyales bacterium]